MASVLPLAVSTPGGEVIRIAGQCTAPELSALTLEQLGSVWLSLISAGEASVAALTERNIPIHYVLVEVPSTLTAATADAVYAKMCELVPKHLTVACATSNRASAVVAIYVGRKQGWGAEETMTWANAAGLKFVGTQALRNWVAQAVTPAGKGMVLDTLHPGLVFRQLFEPVTSTYTYLLGDPISKEAILIDPVAEKAERDATLARDLGLTITVALNTHVHADHVSGTAKLRDLVPGIKSAIPHAPGAHADILLSEGDVIHFGRRSVRVLLTPGHTGGCGSYVLDDTSAVFTGDALLIRGCGRTDFQVGDAATLYHSVTQKLFKLPGACVVYTGHDYNGFTRSSIAEEMTYNPRLGAGRTEAEFIKIMGSLGLAPPKQLDIAVPANLADGVMPVAAAAADDSKNAGGAVQQGAGALPAK